MAKYNKNNEYDSYHSENSVRRNDYEGYEEIRMPSRKVKKKKSRGAGFLKGLLTFIIVILCAILLAKGILAVASDVFAFGKDDHSKIVVEIPKGSGTDQIAGILKEQGVIQYKTAFRLYSKLRKNDGQYKYGEYELYADMDYDDIMAELKTDVSKEKTIKVTIPEGYEAYRIAKLLADKGLGKEEKYLELIKNPTFDYDFLKDLPDTEMKLEGYLFPDTYEFFPTDSEEKVLKKLLDNFNKKMTDAYKEKAKELDMTMNEVVTLASIIEREAGSDEERALVSGVFHNRLKSKNYPYLESCATVQYILKERKEILSTADTEIKSPYNTYKNAGLPIGPIASPGQASIEAALYPEETEYNFFVWSPTENKHLFAKTYEEHLKNVKKANGK